MAISTSYPGSATEVSEDPGDNEVIMKVEGCGKYKGKVTSMNN